MVRLLAYFISLAVLGFAIRDLDWLQWCGAGGALMLLIAVSRPPESQRDDA